MPNLFIILAVYNRKEKTEACLKSIYNQTNKQFTTIVVDDGSSDGTNDMIRSNFPEVIVLTGNGNLWWTGATNVGIEYVLSVGREEDYTVLLNDDLIIPPFYIETLYQLTSRFQDTLIGSVVINIQNPDMIYTGGLQINWWTAKTKMFINSNKKLSSFSKGHVEKVSSITGRGILIPNKVFHKIGLFNAKHYKQCGDLEFPVRASKAGYNLIISYDLQVYAHILEPVSINHLNKISIKDIKKYYFDIRSYTNIKYRYHFAFDTALNPFKGFIYFIFDFFRITTHLIKKM